MCFVQICANWRLSLCAALSTMAESNWQFPEDPPMLQHHGQITGPQRNYTQGHHVHLEQLGTPVSQYPYQYTTPAYNNPLNHTLLRPSDSPIACMTHCEDTPHTDLSPADAMACDQHMNNKCERAARAKCEHAACAKCGRCIWQKCARTCWYCAHQSMLCCWCCATSQRHRQKENSCEAVATKANQKKQTGTGARLGTLNRHTAEGSDGDIKELGEKEAEAAARTPHSLAWTEEEKLKVIH